MITSGYILEVDGNQTVILPSELIETLSSYIIEMEIENGELVLRALPR
ncbi:hypothetical protein [Aneurinibacillus tyrosinisolvens]|nr:hypothetical protein [Aneurinibacillus tyrosinisolvens]